MPIQIMIALSLVFGRSCGLRKLRDLWWQRVSSHPTNHKRVEFTQSDVAHTSSIIISNPQTLFCKLGYVHTHIYIYIYRPPSRRTCFRQAASPMQAQRARRPQKKKCLNTHLFKKYKIEEGQSPSLTTHVSGNCFH